MILLQGGLVNFGVGMPSSLFFLPQLRLSLLSNDNTATPTHTHNEAPICAITTRTAAMFNQRSFNSPRRLGNAPRRCSSTPYQHTACSSGLPY